MSGNIKKSYYAIIPANVRYDKELRPNSKLLYGEITALCNEKGYCWASNSYFAELYKVSKETISRWISELVEKGYISTELIYKEGTNEIVNRYIRINHEPIDKNVNTPIDGKVKDNNTGINNTFNIPYAEIIEFLNEKADKNFKHTTKKTRDVIKARWNEGFRLDDFKKVIEVCAYQWKGKTFNNGQPGDNYLQPSTLFNGKFEERLNWVTKNQPTANNGKTKEQIEHENMLREMGYFD